MTSRIIVGFLLVLMMIGCVDRLFYDVPSVDSFGISISGHIDNQPGPYRVNIFRNFDIDSRDSLKTGVTASRVVISDAEGNSEDLIQLHTGVYETSPDGIRGKVGGIYKLLVELPDGRTYESIPDTLKEGGVVDSVYYKLVERAVDTGYIYSIEIYASSSTETDPSKNHFVWVNKMTYKSTTDPLNEDGPPCYLRPDGICNFVAPCSGFRNVGTTAHPLLEKVHECECCTCWYDQYNKSVVLSDALGSLDGKYSDILLDRIRITGWNMMYKMRIEASMQSLSPQAYQFWKGVRDQRSATANIFQPITGKIPGNIRQVSGPPVVSQGIFYAASKSAKVMYIDRSKLKTYMIPITDFPGAGAYPCYKLAPNVMFEQPAFWID